MSTRCACPMQIVALEKSGGTILGGAIKLIRDKKKNPGPPRDPSLPPKPKGQTVGSFTGGLRMLPEAIAHKMHNKLRLVPVVNLPPFSLVKLPGHDYSYQKGMQDCTDDHSCIVAQGASLYNHLLESDGCIPSP